MMNRFKTVNENKICHAFSDDVLDNHDAFEIAQLLKSKAISQQEVVEATINRAQQVNSTINAIEIDCFDTAKKQAEQPLGHQRFAGVPTFIKDNTSIKGLPTNHGSAAVNARPAKDHGYYAKQYLNQGFNVMGKSVLPEFGFNATTEPAHKEATKNPWNTEYSTGASSGGAAALVASGVVAIAHANDGGGSIRIPAACCGLVGLKPSRGRHINGEQARSLPINIISEGVVTRSVRDTAYFHAEAERYYRNKKLPAIGLVRGPGQRRLKIGLAVDSITGHPTDQETRQTVEDTAKLLAQQGHHIEEIPLPVDVSFIEDFSLYWSLLAFALHKAGKFTADPSFESHRLDQLTLGLSNLYKKNFYKTPLFLYRLKKLYKDYGKLFNQYDAMLTPVLAHTTPKLGHISPDIPFDELFDRLLKYVSFTPLANASGGPAISLPLGHSKDNLPIAIQLSANHGDEKTLLELAYELEALKPWQKIHSL